MRRICVVFAFLLLLGGAARATPGGLPRNLPAEGAHGFQDLCRQMYATEGAGEHWPQVSAPGHRYCEVRTRDAHVAIDRGDYGWLVRKGLKFACKHKRPVIYKTARSLGGCDGRTRSLAFEPVPAGCLVRIAETGTTIRFTRAEIADTRAWRRNMNLFERFILYVLAPAGTPTLVDALAACSAAK